MADPHRSSGLPHVAWHTFGCKANQYDSEHMRQEVEARGAQFTPDPGSADVLVVNTCTVTNQADADARRLIRRMRRSHPDVRVVVAGCSAALHAADYRRMGGVSAVVEGHDSVAVSDAVEAAFSMMPSASLHDLPRASLPSASLPSSPPALVQLTVARPHYRIQGALVGGELRPAHRGRSRGWLKIQDGCDRRCSFCATRLARGRSRSRMPSELVAEARALAAVHAEIVLTGIHIGHYGRDLDPATRLSELVALLLDEVPGVRLRLGSIEASEVDALLLECLSHSDGRLAPHLHMPLQSGSDPVLRRMRRWHTREMYRERALEVAERLGAVRGGTRGAVGSPDGAMAGGSLGMGADIITGFPGETDADHRETVRLVEELPFTYLHVFPFSPREGTAAAEMAQDMPVPQRVAGERSRELRQLVLAKEAAYHRRRAGTRARIVLERGGRSGLTEDYLRVGVAGPVPEDRGVLHEVVLAEVDGELRAVFGIG